jgi:prepilin-type N-terminal cleavage/methylation domain-containing protein
MKNMTSRNRKAGFTYMELMIAMTIFSIMAVSVYSVLRAGIKIWSRSSAIIEKDQALRVFFNTIAADLKNGVAYDASGINFEGRPDGLSVMTLASSGVSAGPMSASLAKVSYYFDAKDKKVKRIVATKDDGFVQMTGKAEEMLSLADGERVSFRYYSGSSVTDQSIIWKDRWDGSAKMPPGISVKVGEFEKIVYIPVQGAGT